MKKWIYIAAMAGHSSRFFVRKFSPVMHRYDFFFLQLLKGRDLHGFQRTAISKQCSRKGFSGSKNINACLLCVSRGRSFF
jgi:hypothetical protein